jgi:hypothetical protein
VNRFGALANRSALRVKSDPAFSVVIESNHSLIALWIGFPLEAFSFDMMMVGGVCKYYPQT